MWESLWSAVLEDITSLKIHKVAYSSCRLPKVLALIGIRCWPSMVAHFITILAAEFKVKHQALLLSHVAIQHSAERPNQVPGRDQAQMIWLLWIVILAVECQPFCLSRALVLGKISLLFFHLIILSYSSPLLSLSSIYSLCWFSMS